MIAAANPLERENKRSKPRKQSIDFRINENTILETEKPVDFSFKKFKMLTAIGIEGARETRTHHIPVTSAAHQKYLTRALWLNNNRLTDIANLDKMVESILEKPMELGWVDFSYNYITKIHEVITKYSNLSIVYFHGNQISDFNEVLKLRELKRLRSVTFHGNPIAKATNYRMTLITFIPQIVNLDFSPVLNSERLMPAPPTALQRLSEIFDDPGEGLKEDLIPEPANEEEPVAIDEISEVEKDFS